MGGGGEGGISKISRDFLENIDGSIVLNFGLSLGYFLVALLLLIPLRQILPIYTAILNGPKRRKISGIGQGPFDWISTTFSMSNERFLALAGMDGYVFVQSMQLFGVIMFSLVLVNVTSLLPIYLIQGRRISFWVDATMESVQKGSPVLWVPFVVAIVSTLVIYAECYIFYRNFGRLRQAFLRRPSAFVPLMEYCEVAESLEAWYKTERDAQKAAAQVFDISARTVIIQGINKHYTRAVLVQTFQGFGFTPEAVVLVKGREKLESLLEERNNTFLQLELLYHRFYGAVKAAAATAEAPSTTTIYEDERIRLMAQISGDPGFCPEARPTETDQKGRVVDAISTCYERLMDLEKELKSLTSYQLSSDIAEYPDDRGNPDEDASQDANASTTQESFDETTFLVRLHPTTTQGPLGSANNSAILLFRDARAASIVKQVLLNSRPYIFQAKAAPTSRDLLWGNLLLGQSARLIRHLLVAVIFWLIQFSFAGITEAISKRVDLTRVEKISILHEIASRHPVFKNILHGVSFTCS